MRVSTIIWLAAAAVNAAPLPPSSGTGLSSLEQELTGVLGGGAGGVKTRQLDGSPLAGVQKEASSVLGKTIGRKRRQLSGLPLSSVESELTGLLGGGSGKGGGSSGGLKERQLSGLPLSSIESELTGLLGGSSGKGGGSSGGLKERQLSDLPLSSIEKEINGAHGGAGGLKQRQEGHGHGRKGGSRKGQASKESGGPLSIVTGLLGGSSGGGILRRDTAGQEQHDSSFKAEGVDGKLTGELLSDQGALKERQLLHVGSGFEEAEGELEGVLPEVMSETGGLKERQLSDLPLSSVEKEVTGLLGGGL